MPKDRTFLNVKLQGLNTFQSTLSEVPAGSLKVADNLVIDKEGILETRRGIRDRLTIPPLTVNANPFIKSFHQYNNNLIMHVESTAVDGTQTDDLYYTDSDTKEPVRVGGLIATPPAATGNIFSTEFRSNFFYTHDDGIYKIDTLNVRPRQSGITRGIALDYGISEVLDKEAVDLHTNARESAIEVVATRDEDPFEIKIPKDQNVDLIGDSVSVTLNFEDDFMFSFDPLLYKVVISADSGLNGAPGIYPILAGSNGSLTIQSDAVDIPSVDYTIPAGQLDLLEDPDNEENIIIKLPPGSGAPPEGLINRKMRIETGTFDESPATTLDILAVTEDTITIRNIFGWEPSEYVIPADTRRRVVLAPDDNIVSIFSSRTKIDTSRRPTLTIPEGFLDIPTELVISGDDVLNTDFGSPRIQFRNEVLAGQGDKLDKANENKYTLLADKPVPSFRSFTTTWFKLPLSSTHTNVEITEGATGYDINTNSVMEVPADTVPVNELGSRETLNTASASMQVDRVIYKGAPSLDTGSGESTSGDPAGSDFVWVGIDRFRTGRPDSIFEHWGRRAIDNDDFSNLGFGRFDYSQTPQNPRPYQVNEIDLQLIEADGSSEIFHDIELDDWILVDNNEFWRYGRYPGESPFVLLTDKLLGKVRLRNLYNTFSIIRFNINNALRNKWFPETYQNYRRLHPISSFLLFSVVRPHGSFTPTKDIVISLAPETHYKFPVPITVKYTEGNIIANKPIQIGAFTDSRRLTRDLYLYKDVDTSVDSDELLKPSPEIFTLTSDRVTGVELRGEGNRNLRVYVSPAFTQLEADRASGGTHGDGDILLGGRTMLAGLTDQGVQIAGASGSSMTIRLTDAQVAIVEAFIANPTEPILTQDLPFTFSMEVPDINIASIEGDSINNTIKLVYERLLTANEIIFDENLQNVNRIFVPIDSTFLGIPGPAFFDITNYKRQTDDDGPEVTISAGEFNLDDLVMEAAPYHTGRYILGDFNIGVIGSFDALNENNLALQPDGQYSYRIVWSYEDSKNNLIVGEPSESLIVTRQLGQRPVNIDLVVTVPPEIYNLVDTGAFKYEIYRSSRSANAASPPLGNEALVISDIVPFSSFGIRAKRFAVTDDVTDNERGKALYTNANQEGIEGANMRPPRALDIAAYREHLMFANAEHQSILELQLNSADPKFLKEGDQFSISPRGLSEHSSDPDSVIFHASKRLEGLYLTDPDNPSLEARNYFKIVEDDTDSVAIEETTKSLIRVINLYAIFPYDIRAHYLSTSIDKPGRFILTYDHATEHRIFSVQSNAGIGNPSSEPTWNPSIRMSTQSKVDPQRNALYFSKYREPEAVPALNFLRIGSDTEPILRIIPLRESLFVFKTDGIFRITGDNPRNLTVEPFDLTIKLLAPKSVVSLANMIICLTNQGIVSITDNGLRIESRPIEDTIQRIINSPDVVKCFAVSYEADRKYILNLPNNQGEIEEQYVLNIITKGWTRWTLAAISGTVWNDKLILANGAKIRQERKTGSESDYQDEDGEAIKTRVEWTTIHANTPDKTKHFPEIRVMFNQAPVSELHRPYVTFKTNQSQDEERVPLHFVHIDPVGFGVAPWGRSPYGSPRPKIEAVSRTYVPRNKQKASLMNLGMDHESLKDKMELTGLAVSVRDLSKRTDK